MQWKCVFFNDLTVKELYDLGQLRQVVFIVEQNCPYLDFDGKDLQGWHLLGYNNEGLLCVTARLLPAGVSYPHHASFGRVVSHPSVRRTGAGKQLMLKVMEYCAQLFPNQPLKISAQSYLEDFYAQYGFSLTGKKYLEDDIPHSEMLFGE